MEWKPEFEIGVELIDAQPRQLFARIGELLASLADGRPDEVGPTMHFLRRYVREHFAAEQALMASVGYPRADAHAAEHARFASDLLALEVERTARPSSPWLASRLGVGLADWLREHVLVADRELGGFLEAQGRR